MPLGICLPRPAQKTLAGGPKTQKEEKMKIRKKEMKKDAVRVNTWADMPRFLVEAGAIVSWGGKLHFLSREGLEEAPFGSVIA